MLCLTWPSPSPWISWKCIEQTLKTCTSRKQHNAEFYLFSYEGWLGLMIGKGREGREESSALECNLFLMNSRRNSIKNCPLDTLDVILKCTNTPRWRKEELSQGHRDDSSLFHFHSILSGQSESSTQENKSRGEIVIKEWFQKCQLAELREILY